MHVKIRALSWIPEALCLDIVYGLTSMCPSPGGGGECPQPQGLVKARWAEWAGLDLLTADGHITHHVGCGKIGRTASPLTCLLFFDMPTKVAH